MCHLLKYMGSNIKINYKKIEPLKNLLELFCLAINKNFTKNNIKFSYKVMKVLFKIDDEMKRKLNFLL